MREILFRGKRKYDKKWVCGYYVEAKMYTNSSALYGYISVPFPDTNYKPSEEYHVYEETVGQFTGLFDKNGNRIFEGDILRHSYWHGNEKKSRNICVRFLNGAFCWSTSADNDENCFAFADSEMYGINTGKDCEVIGNIFDNKELLKKEI